jgi:DNA-binding MarR family transcriptional regulator
MGKKLPSQPAEQLAFSSDEELLFENLVRTHDLIASAYHELFSGFDLSHAQYGVLLAVQASGDDGLPSQKIRSRILTRGPDVTRLVDRLVNSGLVTRERSETDRRVIYVKLTKDGQLLLDELAEPVEALRNRIFGHMSAANQAKLNSLLIEARENVSE